MKRIILFFLILSALFAVSCKNGSEPASVDETETPPTMQTAKPVGNLPPVTAPPRPAQSTEGKAVNLLTGLYINAEAAAKRPFAVVIGNSDKALPQSGISQADIFYEVISEGVTTRIIAVFQDFDAAKIGSVRSARHYFLDFAFDHDAIFVHHGASYIGYASIKELKINDIDGMSHDGGTKTSNFETSTFWRDPERYGASGMREHSSYTNAENLKAQAEKSKFRTDKADGYEGMFDFYEDASNAENAEEALSIKVSYSGTNDARFDYNEFLGVYKRFQQGSQQIDAETGRQLAVTNVLVQITSVKPIPNDSEGRRDVTLIGSGTGWLYTNGTKTPVKWSKTSHQSPTEWTFENGEKLTLNKGKTWICVTNKEPVIVGGE